MSTRAFSFDMVGTRNPEQNPNANNKSALKCLFPLSIRHSRFVADFRFAAGQGLCNVFRRSAFQADLKCRNSITPGGMGQAGRLTYDLRCKAPDRGMDAAQKNVPLSIT